MEPNLEILQRAALQNAQATQQLQGLDEQYGRAEALRDRPMTQANQYGTVSPLALMADVIGKSKGRMDMRTLEPQRSSTRNQIGTTAGQLAGDKLRMSLAKEGRDVVKHEDDLKGSKLRRAVRQRGIDRMQGEADKWVIPGDKDAPPIPVGHDEFNKPYTLDENNNPVPVPEGYVPADSGYGSGGRGGRQFGKAYTYGQSKDIAKQISNTVNTTRTAQNFDPSFAKPIGELPTEFVANLGTAMARNDLTKYIDKDMDQGTKDAMQWWANWRMLYTLPERNAAFGATLTPNELQAWKEAEAVTPGMDAAEIQKRVDTLTRIAKENMMRQANVQMADPLDSNRNYWIRGLDQSGMFDFNSDDKVFSVRGTIPDQSPDGVDQASWDDLDADERKYYMDNML